MKVSFLATVINKKKTLLSASGSVVFLTILLLIACNQKKDSPANTLFQKMDHTGIDFNNKVTNSRDFNIFSYRNFYNGGGVAVGDINNDGLADVFFTANMGSNKLYLNKGNFSFEDITTKAGVMEEEQWSTGVVMVDLNHDGWLDIYVCNAGFVNGNVPESKLFINNHDLTFTESAAKYGLSNTGGYATHAAFFDYDLDGDLDVFIINNSFIPVNTLNYANKRNLRAKDWPVAEYLKGGGDRFLRNDNGRFTDISQEAGIYGSLISFGLGVTVGDVNGDHYPDVYVSNDFFERDYLYINQKNGTFKDELEQWVQHLSHSSMGADLGDVNNDGYPDLFVTEMLPDDDFRLKTTTSFENSDVQQLKVNSGFYYQFMQNTLQVNNRDGKYKETAFFSGVAASDWSWGGLIFDADNDGLSDIYVCNGIYNDVTNQDFIDFFANDVIQKMVMTGQKEQIDEVIAKMPSQPIVNKLFRNTGGLKFSDNGAASGFTDPSFSNGAAYGDLDNDGDLDLVVNNVNQNAFVYKNNSREQTKNNFISISLKGAGQNSFAIGSTVQVFSGEQILTRELIPSRGFQSSVDYKMIFGLGNGTVDSVRVIWPDRTYSLIGKPAMNQAQVFTYQPGLPIVPETSVKKMPLFQEASNSFAKHQEDGYVDSYYDRNIPLQLSHEGPHAAVGDVNGDGTEDVFIGGASGQPGQLYLQKGGRFELSTQSVFAALSSAEITDVLFADLDKDGDLDLLTGTGGNNRDPGNPDLNIRLLRNNGKGQFTWDSLALPSTGTNNAVLALNDIDNDGDLDIFAASRSVSLNYGPSPQSFLLINDGKAHFTDQTKAIAPSLTSAGLLTGAGWADMNGDKVKDLVITGEWMAPRILLNQQGKLTEWKTDLDTQLGWWQRLAVEDMDGDGDQDLILGNMGENFYLQPDSARPIRIWMSDFDKNGTVDKIITRTINGKDVPVFLKRELTDQVVSIKKQNLRYEDYGKRSIQELFTPEQIKQCEVKTITHMASVIAYNEGNGKFSFVRLPLSMQLSSVNALYVTDLNKDGRPDIVSGGNRFNLLPQFCRLDASFGNVVFNEGDRIWRDIPSSQSGLVITGQIRDIKPVKVQQQSYLLFLQNNDRPVFMKTNRP